MHGFCLGRLFPSSTPASLQAHPALFHPHSGHFIPFVGAFSFSNPLHTNLLEMVCSLGTVTLGLYLANNSLLKTALPFQTFSFLMPASVPAAFYPTMPLGMYTFHLPYQHRSSSGRFLPESELGFKASGAFTKRLGN